MNDERKPQSRVMRFLPVVGFAVLAAVLAFGLLRENATDLPSTLIDKPAPQTNLPPLYEGRPGIDAAALADGQVKLVNIWASWCGPCRVEHPSLMSLAAEGVDIRGFNYGDAPADAKAFLARLGDPYTALGVDESRRAAIEWGVYGVPETFVINGEGRIIYKHIGPIQNDDLEKRIMPAIKAAGG